MKPTKCPAIKERGKKSKKKRGQGGEKVKSNLKSKHRCHTAVPKTLKLLVSAHAQTLQANIWHLDQKATKCDL